MCGSKFSAPSRTLFLIEKAAGKAIPLEAGEIIKAEVVDILPSGGVTVSIKGGFITARAEVPLEKGETVFFKVLGSSDAGTNRELRLKFLGKSKDIPSEASSGINIRV
jgi:hypothetical protein